MRAGLDKHAEKIHDHAPYVAQVEPRETRDGAHGGPGFRGRGRGRGGTKPVSPSMSNSGRSRGAKHGCP